MKPKKRRTSEAAWKVELGKSEYTFVDVDEVALSKLADCVLDLEGVPTEIPAIDLPEFLRKRKGDRFRSLAELIEELARSLKNDIEFAKELMGDPDSDIGGYEFACVYDLLANRQVSRADILYVLLLLKHRELTGSRLIIGKAIVRHKNNEFTFWDSE